MENKYKAFIEIIKGLTNEQDKKDCEALIHLAQRYYSLYCQNEKLIEVERRLDSIYKLPSADDINGEIVRRENQLDIRYRLFLEFYKKMIICSGYGNLTRTSLYNWIKDYKKELPELMEEFEIKDRRMGKFTLKEWIERSCKRACIMSKSKKTKKYMYLEMDHIREAIRIFDDNQAVNQISEEESFNNVFSQEFVEYLAGIIFDPNNKVPLCIYIAPIRMQLCRDEEQGRDINNKSYKWCFNKDFRLTVSKLEKEINNKNKYENIFKQFKNISARLSKISDNLKDVS